MSVLDAWPDREDGSLYGARATQTIGPVLTLFFSWGFLTALNDVLAAHLKLRLHLTYEKAMLVQVAFFLTCLLAAFPAGRMLQKLGYKSSMVAGLLTMSIGSLLMAPASMGEIFLLFLLAVATISAGVTALQVSAGPYISLAGEPAVAASRFSLALAFSSLGNLLAPAFGSWLIFPGASGSPAGSLTLPYALISVMLLGLAVFIRSTHLSSPQPSTRAADVVSMPAIAAIKTQHALIFGALVMFLYVGAEVSIGSFLILYLGQPQLGSIPPSRAALCVTLYWASSMIGRFFGASLLRRFAPTRLLAIAGCSAFLLVTVSLFSSGPAAVWSMIAVGLFNSIMVPVIYTHSIADLGPLLATGSSILVGVVMGGACIPYLQGIFADHFGLRHSFLIVLACYVCIGWYGMAAPQNTFSRSDQESRPAKPLPISSAIKRGI